MVESLLNKTLRAPFFLFYFPIHSVRANVIATYMVEP